VAARNGHHGRQDRKYDRFSTNFAERVLEEVTATRIPLQSLSAAVTQRKIGDDDDGEGGGAGAGAEAHVEAEALRRHPLRVRALLGLG